MIEPVWSLTHPANLAFYRDVIFTQRGDVVYIASGHGQAYSAIKFLKLCAETGSVLAEAKLGDAARCWNLGSSGDEIVIVTNKRIIVLREESLQTICQFRKKVPRYVNHLVCGADSFVLGCADQVVIYTNEESNPVRRRVPGLRGLFQTPYSDHVVVCAGGAGELRQLDVPNVSLHVVHKTQEYFCCTSSLQADTIAMSLKDRPKAPNRILICTMEKGGIREAVVDVPEDFKRVQLSKDAKFLCTIIDNRASVWELQTERIRLVKSIALPDDCEIVAVDNDLCRVVSWTPVDAGGVFLAFAFE